MSEIRVPDLPALRVFDPKATRWAVIRGLLRTALVVVGFLVVASLLLRLGVHVVVNVLDRPEQLARMITAYEVAHPGFVVEEGRRVTGGWHQTATLRLVAAGGAEQDARLSLSAFGNLEVEGVRRDRVAEVLGGRAWTRSESASFLRRLPAGVRVYGVAVFPTPQTQLQLVEANFGYGNDALIYGPAFASQTGRAEPLRQDERAVSWSGGSYGFETFQEWARALNEDDDENLRRLWLPSSERIKELAEDGRATAAYLDGGTPEEISALLRSGQVASFTPTAVTFDLSPPR